MTDPLPTHRGGAKLLIFCTALVSLPSVYALSSLTSSSSLWSPAHPSAVRAVRRVHVGTCSTPSCEARSSRLHIGLRSSKDSASDCCEEPENFEVVANGSSLPMPSKKSSKKSRKVRRARCVDFPSSAYRKQKQTTRSRPSGRDRGGGRKKSKNKRRERVPSVSLKSRRSQAASILEPEFASIEESAERTRLLESRSYARSDAFLSSEICRPPTLEDLSPPDVKPFDRYWAGAPFRFSVLIAAYFFFPYLTMFLDEFVTMPPNELDEITSKFGPGISILYGTFVSLTLNILYNRQQSIQKDVSTESALLSLIQRKILSIFRDDRESAIEGSQCVADQIRTLVRGSRGMELMGIMYSDPYARILELIEDHEYKLLTQSNDLGAQGVVLGSARDVLKDLVKVRAQRLSDEALALPPTHFFILSVLTTLILLGYSISILPTVDPTGRPSNESSILFAVLCATYVLFFNFASDINQPFQGVYQLRRSSTATHLLQTKFLIANHPLVRGEVDFDAVEEDENTVRIRSPGLGDMMMVSSDLYPLPEDTSDILD